MCMDWSKTREWAPEHWQYRAGNRLMPLGWTQRLVSRSRIRPTGYPATCQNLPYKITQKGVAAVGRLALWARAHGVSGLTPSHGGIRKSIQPYCSCAILAYDQYGYRATPLLPTKTRYAAFLREVTSAPAMITGSSLVTRSIIYWWVL